ncbi:MAG: LuxR C-terminal-related transcriptional regulator [Solirubrobacterales bacterium]
MTTRGTKGTGDLNRRISDALGATTTKPGTGGGGHDRPMAELEDRLEDALEAANQALREAVGTRRPSVVEKLDVLTELQRLRDEVFAERVTQRLNILAGIQHGLGRLRNVDSVPAILDRATAELCQSCGFDRAVLFRLNGSDMVAESAYFKEDKEWADRIVAETHASPARLDYLTLETEMIRRRSPALVLDAPGDPRTYKPLIEMTQTSSYVAAPIMPEGRVIGFLHADRYFTGHQVDALDRDSIWAFAEGFGYAFERTAMLERMRAKQQDLRDALSSASALVAELQETELDLVRIQVKPAEATSAAMATSGRSPAIATLTRREVDVLELMAEGATNAAIADRLVIAEGTVKSHVKRILRKLSAANRAEAVSRYLTPAKEPGGGSRPGR